MNKRTLFSYPPSLLLALLPLVLFVPLFCCPSLLNAEELLELPNFSDSGERESKELLQLELLTESELRQLQEKSQAAPSSSRPAAVEKDFRASNPTRKASDGVSPVPEVGLDEISDMPEPEPFLPLSENRPKEETQPSSKISFPPTVDSRKKTVRQKELSLPGDLQEEGELIPRREDIEDFRELLSEENKTREQRSSIAQALSQQYLHQLKEALGDWQNTSLMHRKQDITQLLDAIAEFKRQEAMPDPEMAYEPEPIEEILPEEPEEEPKTLLYPIIYVGTIMYVDAENWSVWINGAKFTARNPDTLIGLKVISASPKSVRIQWTPVIEVEGFKANSSQILRQGDSFLLTMQSNQALLAKQFMIHEGRSVNQQVWDALNPADPEAEAGATGARRKGGRSAKGQDTDRLNMNRVINLYRKSEETIKQDNER